MMNQYKYLQIKFAALTSIALVVMLVCYTLTRSEPPTTQQSDYARYASNTQPPQPLPTSDVTPLPVCRDLYINLSGNADYPVPHWVYSLPEHADKALVLAIARNESRFQRHARSHKGAVGLMQLMPATARYMVQQHGEQGALWLASAENQQNYSYRRPRNPFDFSDPYVSLAVGNRYIEHLQEQPYIGDNIVYTLAAYNAGPARLLEWKKRYGHLSQEQFAAHIPYRETRDYVRKVLRDYREYRQLMPNIHDVVWVDAGNC